MSKWDGIEVEMRGGGHKGEEKEENYFCMSTNKGGIKGRAMTKTEKRIKKKKSKKK